MVGRDHTGERVATTKDQMAAGLTAELEPRSFQSDGCFKNQPIKF
jgi:hypothetical protein